MSPQLDKKCTEKTSQGKQSHGIKRPTDKTSHGQNIPWTKRPTLITKFSKKHVVLENWPQPQPQFMIGEFLFWGG